MRQRAHRDAPRLAGRHGDDDEPSLTTDPDGNATLTCYDGDGEVTETVPPVGVAAEGLALSSCATSSLYPSGYLTSETAPSTSSSGTPDQVTTYTYDDADQLTSTETATGTAAAATTVYCYDPDGDRTAVVAPDGGDAPSDCETSAPYETTSGDETGYSYDSAGEVAAVVSPTGTCSSSGETTADAYDPDGNLISSEDANCVTTTNTYDALGDLTAVSYSGSAAHSVSETYDADGNRTSMTDATGTSTYDYDPFGELTSIEDGAGKTVDYTYDALGDETSVTYPLGAGATWAGSDTVRYVYDDASQLSSVTDFDDNTIAVTNNADGLPTRIALGASPDAITTTYDGSNTPVEQVALTSGTVKYLVADALGSIRAIVSPLGALVSSTSYDAWGNPETTGGLTSSTPFGFAGGYTEPTGLVYLIHRYYDPSTGQFLTVDPAVAQTGEPYAYTGDDPVNGTDPSGDICIGLCTITNTAKAVAHGVMKAAKTVKHVGSNAVTEVKSHRRGLAKIGITSVAIVGGTICVAASAGICGELAFSVAGIELSGSAIAIGAATGAGEGAADYALDSGNHSIGGYFASAGLGGLEDTVVAGLPEEVLFGNWAQGAHSAQLGYLETARQLPAYVSSLFK